MSSFKTIDDVVIIGARLAEGSAARDSFKTVASKYRDVYSFALTAPGVGLDGKIYTEADDAAAAAATTVASQELVAGSKGKKRKPGRGVACYHNRDQTTLIADDTDLLSPSTLERFVRRCAEPLVPELNRRNEDELLMQGKSVVYFFHWSAALRATFRRAALPLAKRYEEYLTFCTADSYEFQELYPKLGMGNDVGVAGLTVQNPGLGTIYPYRGDGLSTWMQELWDAGVYEADTEPTAEVPELVAKMRKLVEDFVNDIVEGRIESIKAKTSKFTGRRVVEAPEEEDSKKVDGKEEKVEEKQETTGKEEKQEATGKEEKQEPIGHEEKHDANAQAEATVEKTSEKVEEPTAEPKHDEL